MDLTLLTIAKNGSLRMAVVTRWVAWSACRACKCYPSRTWDADGLCHL